MLSCYARKSFIELLKHTINQNVIYLCRIINLCNNLLPNYHNLYPKCTQWLRRNTAADSGINDQTPQHLFMD